MTGVTDLLESERGVFCILALVLATVVVALGKLDGAGWLEFVKWLTITLVASKTVTTAVQTITTNKASAPATPTTPVVDDTKAQR